MSDQARKDAMADAPENRKRFKVGSLVLVQRDEAEPGDFIGAHEAIVLRHGRDAGGIYTEVQFADGSTDRYERSWLRAVPGLRGE